MFRMNFVRKNKKILLLFVLLLVLTGCTAVTGPDGKTLPEKIIYSTTTWKEMFKNESWFTALITYPVAQLINFLAPKTGVVLAITIATVLVNLLLLPLTIKSTAGTQQMQMMQPELDKIQKKYEGKDDERSRLMMSQEMSALYKKYNVNPMTTLLGTFLTLPVFIAMYNAVIRAESVVNGTFLGVDLQLSPRAALSIGGKTLAVILVIFVIMGITQALTTLLPKWLAKNKNKKDHKIRNYDEKPQKDQTTTMTITMLIMVLFMGFTFPAGMSVYWAVNSIVNIVKTIVIQKLVVEKGTN